MAGVDQRREVGRCTKAARRCEHAGRLIAPGTIERVLGDGEELDMGKSEVPRISRKFLGQFAITEPAARLWVPAPGTEMDFIDRDRCASRIDTWRRRRGHR